MTKELTNKNFYDEINNSGLPVFVDFWANWCPPCRMMDPLIDDLAEEYEGRMVIGKLNTDLFRSVSDKLKIAGIPTYILFYKGEEKWRKVGAQRKGVFTKVFNEFLIFNNKKDV